MVNRLDMLRMYAIQPLRSAEQKPLFFVKISLYFLITWLLHVVNFYQWAKVLQVDILKRLDHD